MYYPLIAYFKKKILRELFVEKCRNNGVSASSILEEMAGMYVMETIKVEGKKLSDLYRRTGRKKNT